MKSCNKCGSKQFNSIIYGSHEKVGFHCLDCGFEWTLTWKQILTILYQKMMESISEMKTGYKICIFCHREFFSPDPSEIFCNVCAAEIFCNVCAAEIFCNVCAAKNLRGMEEWDREGFDIG